VTIRKRSRASTKPRPGLEDENADTRLHESHRRAQARETGANDDNIMDGGLNRLSGLRIVHAGQTH